jgi:hypothetical protein
MDWPRATFLLTMTLRSLDVNQAARANCSSAILVVAPFSESEQLGSQTRTALLTSKPVSPVINMWLSAANKLAAEDARIPDGWSSRRLDASGFELLPSVRPEMASVTNVTFLST